MYTQCVRGLDDTYNTYMLTWSHLEWGSLPCVCLLHMYVRVSVACVYSVCGVTTGHSVSRVDYHVCGVTTGHLMSRVDYRVCVMCVCVCVVCMGMCMNVLFTCRCLRDQFQQHAMWLIPFPTPQGRIQLLLVGKKSYKLFILPVIAWSSHHTPGNI